MSTLSIGSLPFPWSLCWGLLAVAAAVIAAPTRWLARSNRSSTKARTALAPLARRTRRLATASVLLVSTGALGFLGDVVGLWWFLSFPPFGCLVVLAGDRLWAARARPEALQQLDCQLYRIAVAVAGASAVLVTTDLLGAQRLGWPVVPCTLSFGLAVWVAHRAAQANAKRNAFVAEALAGKDGLTIRPCTEWSPTLVDVGAGVQTPTHLVVRLTGTGDPRSPYRGGGGAAHEEVLCGLAPSQAATFHTAPRAVLAWSLVGCAVVLAWLAA